MEKWAEKIDIERGEKLIPSMVYEKMKKSALGLYERPEVMYPISNKEEEIPVRSLKRKRPMSEDDDEEITLREEEEKILRRQVPIWSPLSVKGKKNPLIRPLKSVYEEEEKKKKRLEEEKNRLEEEEKKKKRLEEEEEKKKSKKSLPVYESDFKQLFMDSDTESEEVVLCDGDRDEDGGYSGYKFLLNENTDTFTRARHPKKVYYKSCSYPSVLDDEEYPVPTITKLALDRYNAIEDANYEYVGLVKAYAVPVNGFSYTIRFKARLPAQHPIYFQAMIWQQTPNRDTNEILVNVRLVHPLP